MLPTPDTSHVPFSRIYEPAEDSFLLLDTLSSPSETNFLHSRFGPDASCTAGTRNGVTLPSPLPRSIATKNIAPPLVLEVGPGSGVVIAFVHAHAEILFGTGSVLTAAIDVSRHACVATQETAARAAAETTKRPYGEEGTEDTRKGTAGQFLDVLQGDLVSPLRGGIVDVLIFNPPYVPTEEMPRRSAAKGTEHGIATSGDRTGTESPIQSQRGEGGEYDEDDDDYLISLSWAGGRDGMETTGRLLESLPYVLSARGCAYVLLCAQNQPEEVKRRIRDGLLVGREWHAETVGSSGKKAGWEKLQVIRIWRKLAEEEEAGRDDTEMKSNGGYGSNE